MFYNHTHSYINKDLGGYMKVLKITDYMMVKEAAEFLGITPVTLRRWEKDKKVKSYRNPQNKYRLYLKEDLEELLQKIKPVI